MKIRSFCVAAFAALALTAVMGVASASAAEWFVGGSKLVGSTGVAAKKVANETKLELTAAALGFKLTATGIECSGCTIDNNTAGVAHSAGKLVFTGVTVDEPAGCKVASTLETGALTDEVTMGVTAGHTEEAYDKFFTDESAPFITIKITECAAAGSYKVSGSVTGLSPNKTGVEKTAQALKFDETAQTNGGGALTMGGKTAQLMGEVENTLTGANAGKVFGAK